MQSPTRELMLRSAVELLRERGYSGTGLREVVDRSGAPRGSIYHHFPGGKVQLAEEGVHRAGARIVEELEPVARTNDPIATLRVFAHAYESALQASDFRLGCPIAAAANEFSEEAPELAAAAAHAFTKLERLVAASLRHAGVVPARARRLAVMVVCAIEGATLMCRARRDTRPLNDVRRELEIVIEAALDPAEEPPGRRGT